MEVASVGVSADHGAAPPSVEAALQQSVSIYQQLGKTADRHDEVSHDGENATNMYEPGSFVRTVFESGGDPDDNIPAFSRGNVFCVICQHDGGWLEVAEGFLLVSWVVRCDPPENADAIRRRSIEARDARRAQDAAIGSVYGDDVPQEYVIERGQERLGLQIAGGSEEHPGIFVKKV